MERNKLFGLFLFALCLLASCNPAKHPKIAEQWKAIEIKIYADGDYQNPYTDIEVSASFNGPENQKIIRPAFWNKENEWIVRFASPIEKGEWKWTTKCSNPDDKGLHQVSGKITSTAYSGKNKLLQHGFLKMSKGKRNLTHQNGKPFMLVGDTPWALPFRGTKHSASVYAKDRKEKGFNATLLMTIQPDKKAEGPHDRVSPEGFERGFFDLPGGHLNQINSRYFEYFDSLILILLEHEIVPVYQPVFQGFGWKGLHVAGRDLDSTEYNRYCRYLIARYGAYPAIWLVSGDNTGLSPCIAPAGREIEKWDAYNHPTGIHYNPFDDYCPKNQPESKCFHENKSHQEAEWLDFQWCQTGHNGKHLLHKVEKMYQNKPTKAVANGEPTYEGMGGGKNGLGWWQGEEAWMQLLSGGTMGVVYGAADLWQWKLYPNEPGWTDWSSSNLSWKEAIHLAGSKYVGNINKAFENKDFLDMEKHPKLCDADFFLAKPEKLYVTFFRKGGEAEFNSLPENFTFQWFDPVDGSFFSEGIVAASDTTFEAPDESPWVLFIND